jgi:GNAT superfamily N-acetyltransferase
VVLTAEGVGGDPPLELRPGAGPDRHPRAARAPRYRRDLQVWTDPEDAGVLVLGRGLAGRREVAFEVNPARRGRGLGRQLVTATRHLVPAGEVLFAQWTQVGGFASLPARSGEPGGRVEARAGPGSAARSGPRRQQLGGEGVEVDLLAQADAVCLDGLGRPRSLRNGLAARTRNSGSTRFKRQETSATDH